MKIHTYHEPVPGLTDRGYEEMLALWKQDWEQAGHEVVILSEKDAISACPELHKKLDLAIAPLQTINPKLYTRATFMRWLAMSGMGGLMLDYDVFVNPSLKQEADNILERVADRDCLTLYSYPCPCMVSGRAEDFRSVVQVFIDFANSPEAPRLAHLSDQEFFIRDLVPVSRDGRLGSCRCYSTAENSAPFLHFSHDATGDMRSVRLPTICSVIKK
jgi:hypothetical protein